jgi:RNA polymerase sigma factor for flagellar operon FliA
MRTATDVDSLFETYQETRDPAVREQLIVAHMQLVRYVASRMLPGLHSSVELQDLVSYGMFGLIDAIERFDLSYKVKFQTFASYRIQGAINDEMRAQAWEPRSVRARFRQIQTAATDLEHNLGRAPSEGEVATLVGISVAELRRVEGEMRATRVHSLSTPLREADGTVGMALEDVIVGADLGEVHPQINEMRSMLATAMSRLPVNERVLLQLIYVERLRLKDIARVLHVTDSWVSHLHTRSLVSLQRALTGQSA